MTGASIEATLELWVSSLRDVKASMLVLFTQERVAASANLFLDGLLGEERRDIEGALRRACKGYVLGVKSNHYFGSWVGKPMVADKAEEIAHALAPEAWQRLSAGEGTKGARLHDWAYCELADLDAN